MPFLTTSLDVFLATSFLITIGSLYLIRPWSQPAPGAPRAPFRTPLSLLILIHSLYVLYILLVTPPPNLFSLLHIPLTTPSDKIRALLLAHARLPPDAPLPPSLEDLLTRLSSFDVRTIYIRFGQPTVQSCSYCHTFDDYLLHYLPGPLLSYVRTAAVLGLVTLRGSFHERWRRYAVGLLVCAAVTEAYWTATVEVKIPRTGLGVIMWHDYLWTARHLLFLSLPLLVHLLPLRPPPPSPASLLLNPASPLSLTSTVQASDAALARLALLKHAHGAIARHPDLRQKSGTWWAEQRQEGEWARADERVRVMADKLGVGTWEEGTGAGEEEQGLGTLRKNARTFVAALWRVYTATKNRVDRSAGSTFSSCLSRAEAKSAAHQRSPTAIAEVQYFASSRCGGKMQSTGPADVLYGAGAGYSRLFIAIMRIPRYDPHQMGRIDMSKARVDPALPHKRGYDA
ncbi:hypothetical protein PUNSTDRAFT_44485 [Punctularia strigosozonata HHB-11173 SS5]|uniref:uncharacterized protein n=1 Tax=Punctularia strigosozonata (strain HHB-11173) TaxID=741275 RepID=UPI00044176E8|nr:uncharacterized protein PUNSTDRAFT_44485 [Punctularia strigosozonata HHB-11173 SS5]EIN09010.1 hypothetical protein PUNSTDRAFT_44485 [Punctularia strigosozonata HHB-11173 SS5]